MLPEQSLDAQDMAQRYEHLRNVPVMSYKECRPRILIGLNNLHAIAPVDARLGGPGEPIAVNSPLGWTIYGPSRGTESYDVHVVGHHDEVQRLDNAYTLKKALDYRTRKVEAKTGPVVDQFRWRRHRYRISEKHECLSQGTQMPVAGSPNSVQYCGRSGGEVVQGLKFSVRSERASFAVDKQAPREKTISGGRRSINAKEEFRSRSTHHCCCRWRSKTSERACCAKLGFRLRVRLLRDDAASDACGGPPKKEGESWLAAR